MTFFPSKYAFPSDLFSEEISLREIDLPGFSDVFIM